MREYGFDAVKGGAILLVVFGHVWLGLGGAGLIADPDMFSLIERAIYLFHMPVFFFVSGLFFTARGTAFEFLKTKVWTLLWPLVLWSWVEGAALFVSGQGAGRGLSGALDLLTYPVPVKSVFWFLWALFVLQLIAYIGQRVFARGAPLALAGTGIAAVLYFLMGLEPGPAVTILENAPYFMAGVVVQPFRGILVKWRPLPFMIGAGMLVLAEVIHLHNPQGTSWFQLTALLAVIGFVGMIGRLGNSGLGRVLAWLGARTMSIYLIHIILTAATRIALLKLGVIALGPHLVAGMVMGVAVPLAIDAVAQRLRLGGLAGFGQRVVRRT